MSDPTLPAADPAHASEAETLSALFAHLVIQQANTALMLLGKMPEPQSGQTIQDLEGAKLFIDQLEMLEAKTKGNLDPQEQHLLRQSLASVRLAFVEVVGAGQRPGPHPPSEVSGTDQSTKAALETTGSVTSDTGESRKKLTKKY